MGRRLRPGTATLVGLRWLASMGPATIEAWAVAMGWRQTTVYSHASRLVAAGWAESQPMTQGTGSLIYPTKAGVQIARIDATPLAAPPAPSTWAHCEACAWTGAWLTARGRQMMGPRELLACDDWHAEVQWIERGGVRHRGHRPDLVAGVAGRGPLLPIEVELTTKSTQRLRAILNLHAGWIAAGKARAVIYVCETDRLADRVRREAKRVGLSPERKTLRVELLQTIRIAAADARRLPRTKSLGGVPEAEAAQC
jgi:hypothetical protein